MALFPGATVFPGEGVFPASRTAPRGRGTRVIRELSPLRITHVGTTPNGRRFRWGGDDPDPANRARGTRWSSQMPGGWEEMSCVLPRKPGLDYADLGRLSTLQLLGAGGEVCGEFRLERAPRVSGEQMSVSPAARGWAAHLEDDRTASIIFIDRDLGRWQGPSAQRRLNLINADFPHQSDASNAWDASGGMPALVMSLQGHWASPTRPVCEAWYDAGASNRVGEIYAAWSGVDDANFELIAATQLDPIVSAEEFTSDLYSSRTGTFWFRTSGRYRYARIVWRHANTDAGADGSQYDVNLTLLTIIGQHGLPLRYTIDAGVSGYLASDMVAYTVSRWAPLLNLSKGHNGTVLPSGFVVPQAAFHDPTTVAAIIDEVNRYELFDWAVWENRTFWYHPRGAQGRRWKARVAPSGLEETGPQADRIFNGVVVQFQDVDGSTRTVGPPGSGSDTESAALLDTDPSNPANQLNMRRWDVLNMGMVNTAEGAITTGARFLQEAKLLDTSGRARFVGYIEDANGTKWPYYHVRAGDTVEFVDSSDRRPRRIVRADYDADARAVTVDLDSPPEAMSALLARMGLDLVRLGM